MKKALILISIFILSLNISFAQRKMALHHNGQSSFYASFDSLKVHIQSGDTIYLPGGGINIGTWNIDKTVYIFGTGHNPDSTVATGSTYLNGNLCLKTGADNSFLQGFHLNGNVTFGTNSSDQIVNNVVISRCNLNNVYLSFDGTTATTSSNISIRESIIRGPLSGGFATNVSISNNFIQSTVGYFNNMLFSNNIMMANYCWNGPFSYINNSTIQNNILNAQYGPCSGNYFMSNCNSNHFANNIFNQGWAFPDGSNTGSGNWPNTGINTVFVNQSGVTFNYTHNYHLQSPSTYLGTDGTQIGIYGGIYSFKEGSVPQNPHIISKTIQQNTDNSGNLNINIRVNAQDN